MKKLLIFILLFDFIFAFARLNIEPGRKYPVTRIESNVPSELFLGFSIYEDSIAIDDDIYKDIDSLFGNDYCGIDTILLISRSFRPYSDSIATNVFYIMHRDKALRVTKTPDGNIEYTGEDEMIKEEQSDIFTDSEPVLRDAVRQWPLDTVAKLFTCSTFGLSEEYTNQSIERIVMSGDSILEWQYIIHPFDIPAHWSLNLTEKINSKYNDRGVDVNKVLQRKYWNDDTHGVNLNERIYVVGTIGINQSVICKNKTTGQKYVANIPFEKVCDVEEILRDSLHISSPGWAMLMTNFDERLLDIISNNQVYRELSKELVPVSRPNFINTYYYKLYKTGNYKTLSFVVQPACYLLAMCNGQFYRQLSGRDIAFKDNSSYYPVVIPLFHKDLLGLFDDFYDDEDDDEYEEVDETL